MTTMLTTLTIGVAFLLAYLAFYRLITYRLARARARVDIRTRLHQHLNRRALEDLPTRKLTPEERIDAHRRRVAQGIRENALKPYTTYAREHENERGA